MKIKQETVTYFVKYCNWLNITLYILRFWYVVKNLKYLKFQDKFNKCGIRANLQLKNKYLNTKKLVIYMIIITFWSSIYRSSTDLPPFSDLSPFSTYCFLSFQLSYLKIFTICIVLISLVPSEAGAYSRRLRSPIYREQRYFIQSLDSNDQKNFNNLQCGGLYQKPIFSKLDSICNDCYKLYKEPEIYSLCR